MGEVQRYTLADVATRTGRGGAPMWIVYKDIVYDVTNYVNEHPGGVDSLAEEAGTDATKALDEVGHTKDALIILAKLKIGEIVESIPGCILSGNASEPGSATQPRRFNEEEKKYDANGKKKKRVVKVAPEESGSGRSCLSIITCGLAG